MNLFYHHPTYIEVQKVTDLWYKLYYY